MEAQQKTTITVENSIDAPIEKVWDCWTNPKHITEWCFASADWHSSNATNELWVGGRFLTRMEARDGSMGFDFSGIYDSIKLFELITYTLDDGRKVSIHFTPTDQATKVVECFEAETENSVELQKFGWQAILDQFKKYTEESI